VSLLVRTWNVFHGNTVPPQRRAFLREMVELAAADGPDVLCLQEVPVWALARLEQWSGMRAFPAVGLQPRALNAEVGRLVTDLHHGILRSAFTGEGIVTLVSPRHPVVDERRTRIAPERVVLAVALEDGPIVVNVHLTGGAPAAGQFRSAVALAEGDRVVLAGDLNLRPPYALEGFSEPLAGSIDQVLVHGMPSTPPVAWPVERRLVDGRLLSDHAPVEATVG